jgi:hypothetical protein
MSFCPEVSAYRKVFSLERKDNDESVLLGAGTDLDVLARVDLLGHALALPRR